MLMSWICAGMQGKGRQPVRHAETFVKKAQVGTRKGIEGPWVLSWVAAQK